MTPRRYLATHLLAAVTLTVDNRDHASLAESQQDEITALRNDRRQAQERERALILKLDAANAHIDALEAHNAELVELVQTRDEQIARFNDAKD